MSKKEILYFVSGAIIATCIVCFFSKQKEAILLTDAWKDARGEFYFDAFQLKNGKTTKDCLANIVSKEGWSFIWQGNSYLLYEINEGELEKDSNGEFKQQLNIGLLDSDRNITNKDCLVSGVKNISKIKVSPQGEPFVSANLADGTETNIIICLPKPFDPLPDMNQNAEAYLNAYRSQILSSIYGDFPPEYRFSAVDYRWISSKKNELLNRERRKILDLHVALFSEEGKSVEDKLNCLSLIGRLISDEISENNKSDDFISTSHAALDEYTLQETMNYCWEGWIKSIKYPEGWRKVRNAKGVFRGRSFVANEGLVLIDAKVKNDDTGELDNTFLILRLLPEQYREEWCYSPTDWAQYYEEKIGFELIYPEAVSGSYLPEKGDFVLRDGVWVENTNLESNVEPSPNYQILSKTETL